MTETTLSVIMPARNAAAFIVDAIRSIAVNTNVPTELIVVDDGSTDRTADIVKNLAFENLVIKIVQGAQKGVANARNVGLANMSTFSKFVMFLDSDDVNPSGKIQRQLEFHHRNPEHLAIFGMILYFDFLDSSQLMPTPNARTALVRGIQLGSGIFKRRIFAEVGKFDEDFDQGEDGDFYFRAHEMGLPINYEDDVGIYYRRHPDNMTNDRPAVRTGFMKAIKKSIARRQSNPTLLSLDGAKLYKDSPS